MLWLMLWLLWMLLVRWRLGGARQDSWHNHLLTWHQDNMRTSHITHYILPHITHATHVWWPLNIIKVGYNPLISEDISIRHAKLRLRLRQLLFNALFEMVAAYRQLPQGLHNIVTHCLYVCIALYFTFITWCKRQSPCLHQTTPVWCPHRSPGPDTVWAEAAAHHPPPHAGIHNSVSRYPVSSVYISSILSTIRYTMRPFSPVLTLLTICGCVSGEPCMRACHHSAACSTAALQPAALMEHCFESAEKFFLAASCYPEFYWWRDGAEEQRGIITWLRGLMNTQRGQHIQPGCDTIVTSHTSILTIFRDSAY